MYSSGEGEGLLNAAMFYLHIIVIAIGSEGSSLRQITKLTIPVYIGSLSEVKIRLFLRRKLSYKNTTSPITISMLLKQD